MIDGLILTPLRQIFDERGKVMHMMREDSPVFSRFGEIYFSCTYPGVVKAWHLHKEMTLNYAVIHGSIKFVLFDDRPQSPTKGELQELFISPENYMLVTVPPLIWNGFKCVGTSESIVANCSTLPHCRDEIERRPPNDSAIPYNWELVHR
ncbi:dTDP-4-dehydrorhamnose 3,5-epimerase family protein [Desulfosediminicola sp.]|uniref:dTDP-4-dehydrorhamnose 3,5-epimerase family protein n=1 Tax=Desulfosediminicola sp. TaxID=2886825 RepID=UPI003AF2E216